MNQIFLTGRLTKDPEMQKTQSGIDVAHFSVAVDRPGTTKENRITDFFDCTVWGGKDGPGRAGVIGKYFRKGSGIAVRGVMQQRKWQDKEGNTRISWEVKVDDFEFPIGGRSDAGQGGTPSEPAQKEAPPADPSGFAKVNDELPF